MSFFTKESLETLRQRIDLPEVISSYIDLKRAGAAFKALCPFHDEKSPSFTVQRGDSHFHCFGCGAHGDAIAFLMNFQSLSFSDAVELLAEKFQVQLERSEGEESKGPSKKEMRDCLELAKSLYHALLLHTEEGHLALKYLYQRGITLDFVKRFEIGFAMQKTGVILPILKSKGFSDEIIEVAGLAKNGREFFLDRILFPIRNASGSVIGFSGRKFKEETFGGKYVNTPETPLFKKSKVLFGLNYCRARIAKERIALIVEGQIDALKMIDAGLDFVVAGQGTAFGESHAAELIQLGVLKVYLGFDADLAGFNAAVKVGDFFQKEGIEVKVLKLPPGYDPDQFLKEKGKEALLALFDTSEDYLNFLVHYYSQSIDPNSPAGKNELAKILSRQVRSWNEPLMVHESLKKMAELLKVPESMVGAFEPESTSRYLKKSGVAGHHEVDPHWVVEVDLLRWLVKGSSQFPSLCRIAKENLKPDDFKLPITKQFYSLYLEREARNEPFDLLEIVSHLEEGEGQNLLAEITEKKISLEKADRDFKVVLQALLDRNWMAKRDQIHMELQNGFHSDEEALDLARQFEAIKRAPPKLLI